MGAPSKESLLIGRILIEGARRLKESIDLAVSSAVPQAKISHFERLSSKPNSLQIFMIFSKFPLLCKRGHLKYHRQDTKR